MSSKPAPPISKPAPEEFASFYAGYIDKVPATGPLASLEAQRADIKRFEMLNDEKGAFRYADAMIFEGIAP